MATKAPRPGSMSAGILAYIVREKVADDIFITSSTIKDIMKEVKASKDTIVYDRLRELEARGFLTREKVSTGGFIIKLVTKVPADKTESASKEVVSVPSDKKVSSKVTSRRKSRSSRKRKVLTEKKSNPEGKTLDQEIAGLEEVVLKLQAELTRYANIHKKLVDARDALKEK